ncbi:MAG: YafY family transcriptional regulator [Lachnospiraceae bacterium]|nr:YafY family transcriptional regulator [Lachnospiraceae bacterium]
MKLDRMIGILSILLQKEKVTAPYLAGKFEVSRRTIIRDIDALCMAGIPIVTEQGQNGGISIMENYKMDKTLLSTSDMQAILAGLRSLDSVSGTSRYAQLMEKLSVGASDMLSGDAHILINLSSRYKETLSPKIELLHGAICAAQTVSFTYFAPKGESRRVIEPYYLIFEWAGWYVWGWCTMRRDYRLFKLNRMVELQIGELFEKRTAPPPEFMQKDVFPCLYQVKAIIQPQFRWRLVDEFGPESFVQQSDGSLLFTHEFADKIMIITWIMSFGRGAELIEPAELRQDVRSYAEEICQKYVTCAVRSGEICKNMENAGNI